MPHTNMLEERDAALVIVDVQEKMLSAIGTSPTSAIIDKICRLVNTAEVLGLPIIYTEQYPKGLGATDAGLKACLARATGPLIKTTCSCWRDEPFKAALQRTERNQIIVAGLESHVCIQQTVMDLIRVDYQVFVPVDAIGSRFPMDMTVALERIRHAGAELSTTESLIFELIERCDHPKFKDILKLIK